jgi:hypothetical protein
MGMKYIAALLLSEGMRTETDAFVQKNENTQNEIMGITHEKWVNILYKMTKMSKIY